MKIIKLLILFIIIFQFSQAQEIAGRWQSGSSIVADGYNENYQFFHDGTFCFHTSDYDELSRIATIGGMYKIVDKKLILTPTYYIEVIGGVLSRSELGADNNTWTFANAKADTVQIKQKNNFAIPFRLYKDQNKEIIEIQRDKYYKIPNDANKK